MEQDAMWLEALFRGVEFEGKLEAAHAEAALYFWTLVLMTTLCLGNALVMFVRKRRAA